MNNQELILVLQEAYKDKIIRSKLENATDINEIITILQTEKNYVCSAEDLKKAIVSTNTFELTETQLNQVSGGKYIIDDIAFGFADWLGKKVGNLFK